MKISIFSIIIYPPSCVGPFTMFLTKSLPLLLCLFLPNEQLHILGIQQQDSAKTSLKFRNKHFTRGLRDRSEMNFRHLSRPYPLFLAALLCFLNFPQSLSVEWFSICSTKFSCGIISDVDYPFWGGGRPGRCGHPQLKLNCDRNITTIQITNVRYNVLNINQKAQTLRIKRADWKGICSPEFSNIAFESTPFEYAPGSGDISFVYNCSKSSGPIPTTYFTCPDGSAYKDGYALQDPGEATETGICNASVTVGIGLSFYGAIGNSSAMEKAVREGFEVEYNKVDTATCGQCTHFSGVCGYDSNSAETVCFCRNQSTAVGSFCLSAPPMEAHKPGSNVKRDWTIGVLIALVSFITISILIAYAYKKGHFSSNVFDVEAILRSSESFAPKRYSYSNVRKMTKSFAEKIGRGGYGSVYKGKLEDGHLVAVKVLNDSKDNGEDFINEVASIGKTSHVNIVTLIGFCYERTKRALIYDYMPNGSLDKFIFSQGSTNTNRTLEWKTVYEIAVGIAQGLEYLHRDCKTRILHFDIKPQNILLDKNFCPKISDFGLAKLWLRKESIMSMVEARGTAGYIAPEVFNRNYGGVSHKSDVYSYGMLILEMVGGRKNFDSGVSRSNEEYYPHWIYKQNIELGNDLTALGVTTEEEKKMSRKMVLAGFWCIQTNPSDRPSMSEVVEMLKGSVQSLPVPPKPFLFSPPMSPQQSTTPFIQEHGAMHSYPQQPVVGSSASSEEKEDERVY